MSEQQDPFERELQEALRALEDAEGDVESVLRNHPDAERLRPYLELTEDLLGLLDSRLPSNDPVKQEFLDRVRDAQAKLRRKAAEPEPPENQ